MRKSFNKEVLTEILSIKDISEKVKNYNSINIYELAFDLCMEYAYSKRYYLNVDKTSCEVWKNNKLVHVESSNKKPKDSKAYESVLKACKWIHIKEERKD